MRRYGLVHREFLNAKKREKYKLNREVSIDNNRKYRLRLKAKVLKMLGGKCVICGTKDIRILTVNHGSGNGLKHMRNLGSNLRHYDSLKFYRDIATGKIDKRLFDVRCFNHNILYDYERGIRKIPKGMSVNIGDY